MQSHATDKNVQFIGNKNYFLLIKVLPLLDMAESRFSCDVMQLFCTPISQEETRRQKRPIAPARVARERDNDFFWPETISMDGFICGKWTSRPGYPCKG